MSYFKFFGYQKWTNIQAHMKEETSYYRGLSLSQSTTAGESEKCVQTIPALLLLYLATGQLLLLSDARQQCVVVWCVVTWDSTEWEREIVRYPNLCTYVARPEGQGQPHGWPISSVGGRVMMANKDEGVLYYEKKLGCGTYSQWHDDWHITNVMARMISWMAWPISWWAAWYRAWTAA